MANEEQRSPWLPIQPEGQSPDDASTPTSAAERELSDPAPPRPQSPLDPLPGAPSFDDLLSPVTQAGSDPAPASTAFTPPPASPPVSAPSAYAGDATEPEPIASAYAPPTDAAPPVVPVRSPYLNAERPRAQHSAYQPPSQATTAQEAWGIDRRAIPTPTGAIPEVTPTLDEPDVAPSKPAVPYAPWTSSIPIVSPATTEIERPVVPAAVTPPVAAPAASFSEGDGPEPDASGLVRGLVPTPIEGDEGDIIAPVQPPAASEIQPQSFRAPEDTELASQAGVPTADADPSVEGTSPDGANGFEAPGEGARDQEFTPDDEDPVRQLGAAALSTARLEAAGAPTPRAGIPLVHGGATAVPSFGNEEPFVPRFEPLGGVVPAAVPSVSFTDPAAAPRLASPLVDVAVPESDEPAYVPKAEWRAEALAPVAGSHHHQAHVEPQQPSSPDPTTDAEPLPSEDVSPEQGVSDAGAGEDPPTSEAIFGAPADAGQSDANASPAEPAATEDPTPWDKVPELESTAPSWEGIIDGHADAGTDANAPVAALAFPPVHEAPDDSAPDDSAPEHSSPDTAAPDTAAPEADERDAAAPPTAMTASPAASFFAATAARNARFGPPVEDAAPLATAFGSATPEFKADADAGPAWEPARIDDRWAEPEPEPEPEAESDAQPPVEPAVGTELEPDAATYDTPELEPELLPELEPETLPELEPDLEPVAEAPLLAPHRDVTRTEPLRTDATPYTQSQGAWGASSAASAAAASQAGETATSPAVAASPTSGSFSARTLYGEPSPDADATPWAPLNRPTEDAGERPMRRSGDEATSAFASGALDDAATRALTPPASERNVSGAVLTSRADASGRADAAAKGDRAEVADPANTKGRGRMVWWMLLVAIVAAAAAIVVYRAFFLPEPVILPVPTVTAAAPTPIAEPVAITEESDFVAAMPTVVGTDVLLSYEVADAVRETNLPARAAEHVTLTYGPDSADPQFTVDAYQHYTVDDAEKAYQAYAVGAPDVEDVVVNDEVVGQRAFAASSAEGNLVWRNGTAVFVLKGPAKSLVDFYANYGV